MRLSILICTIEERAPRFNVLMAELNRQMRDYQISHRVEVLSECDNRTMTIGAKRNLLLSRANGDYTCFIDDDDSVDGEYMIKILNALESDPDCVKIIGMMNTDGFNLRRFEHSIEHSSYYELNNVYYRYPNHLNPIKRDISQQFKFQESNFGEDTDWATQIRNSGLLQTEGGMDRVIYHYLYNSRK